MDDINAAPAGLSRRRLCRDLSVSRSALSRRPRTSGASHKRASLRALSAEEKTAVLNVLHSERFVDSTPEQIYAILLDEGQYLCSVRTMYRLLKAREESRERRQMATRPAYKKPELLATGPRQVWSWDITRLKGPEKWQWFYLYVILDIFSRYVVGWLLAERETGDLATTLIQTTCERQGIQEGQLVIHSDRGAPMTSHNVTSLMELLGVTPSLGRPSVSDDNPYSESQFKTMKYHPTFPERFDDMGSATAFCRGFFKWYNREHRHSGLGLMTPFAMHFGHAAHLREQRKQVLARAFERHPERFVKGLPQPAELPTAVWINPPVSPEKSCEQAGPEEVIASEKATDNLCQNDSTGHTGAILARTLS